MTLYRTSLLASLALLSSGCLQYVLVMGNGQQKANAHRKVIGAAVGDAKEKHDCPRWISGLNSVRETLPVLDFGGKGTTWYGSEIRDAYSDCLFQGLLDLKRGKGTEREHLAQFVERIDLVLSLPLAELKIDGRKNTTPPIPGKLELPQLRAELVERIAVLDRAAAERLARQQKRIEAGTLAESKGWAVAALAAWLSVEPLDEAMKAQRAEAVTRLGPLARGRVAVPVAIAPDGAPAPLLAQLRASSTLRARPTLQLVERADDAAVLVHVSVGAFARDTTKERVNFEHSYVSATREVPNPQIESLQKDLARFEKEALWNEKGAQAACTNSRGGPCKLREMRLHEARNFREKAANTRQKLAHEKPTVRRDVVSTYPWVADKTVLTVSAPLAVTMTSPRSAAPSKVTGTAKVQRTAMAWAGNSKVGLAGRNDALPDAAEVEGALTAECVRLLADAALAAPALAAGEFDAPAAATSEPLEKFHHAWVRALRSGQSADVEAVNALAHTLLATKVDPAVMLKTLALR